MAKPKAKTLVVVGCPRSGTSLFAKMLVASGLKTVPDRRVKERYPAGFFEHMPILMFNKAMERLKGGQHRITTEPFIESRDLEDDFVGSIFELAYKPLLTSQVDFIKSPDIL